MKVFRPTLVHHEPLLTALVYPTQYQLMYGLARFQEFYENPALQGRIFTRQDVQDFQPDYYVRWNGCNFPAQVVDHFHHHYQEWRLDAHEEAALASMPRDRYIVGLHLGADIQKVLLHERAHALFAASPQYREAVEKAWWAELRADERATIQAELLGRGYSEKVVIDEWHAYRTAHDEWAGVPYPQALTDLQTKTFSRELEAQ